MFVSVLPLLFRPISESDRYPGKYGDNEDIITNGIGKLHSLTQNVISIYTAQL